MVIALVAAMDEARLIGVCGRLPWHSPADMAHFRALTMDRPVIGGWRTWQSIGRPLPGRTPVLINSRRTYPVSWFSGFETDSLALALADFAWRDPIIIGGASIYAQTLPLASRLYLTRIRHTFPAGEGAVYFPAWDGFRMVGSKHREADAANPWPMDFETWERT